MNKITEDIMSGLREPAWKGVDDRGTLGEKESHPIAQSAREYVLGLGLHKLALYQESFSSCAIEGNRLGEVCSETLHRLLVGQPVSDRYILGLAWAVKSMEDDKEKRKQTKKTI